MPVGDPPSGPDSGAPPAWMRVQRAGPCPDACPHGANPPEVTATPHSSTPRARASSPAGLPCPLSASTSLESAPPPTGGSGLPGNRGWGWVLRPTVSSGSHEPPPQLHPPQTLSFTSQTSGPIGVPPAPTTARPPCCLVPLEPCSPRLMSATPCWCLLSSPTGRTPLPGRGLCMCISVSPATAQPLAEGTLQMPSQCKAARSRGCSWSRGGGCREEGARSQDPVVGAGSFLSAVTTTVPVTCKAWLGTEVTAHLQGLH